MESATPRKPFRAACALVAAAFAIAALPHDASAAVVCQRKKKVFLRPGPGCKKKETLVTDLGTLAAADRVDALERSVGARLGVVENEIGLQCLQAATKGFAATTTGGVPAHRIDGCRALDGNPSACLASFEASSEGGPVSCFYYVGRCVPCEGEFLDNAACVNACDPPHCPGAPGLVFAGRFSSACAAQKDKATCEAAFADAFDRPESCFWDGAECKNCQSFQEREGKCVNACGIPLATCASRPGPPEPEDNCGNFSLQADCEKSWEDRGTFGVSCFYDTASGQCRPCDVEREFLLKKCQNSC